jgi:hypothetical protein
MADTVITNTPPNQGDNSAAGWIVAFIILLAVVVGGFVLYRNGAFRGAAPAPAGTTNVNVTVPNPITPAPSGTTQ